MSSIKYAIMVPKNQRKYIYVTDINGDVLKPILFDDKKVAEDKVAFWGPKAKVVEYEEV